MLTTTIAVEFDDGGGVELAVSIIDGKHHGEDQVVLDFFEPETLRVRTVAVLINGCFFCVHQNFIGPH